MCAEGSNMYSYHDCAKNCTYASTKGEFGDKSAKIQPISRVSEKEANKITVVPSRPRYLLRCMHKQRWLLIKISPFPTHKNGRRLFLLTPPCQFCLGCQLSRALLYAFVHSQQLGVICSAGNEGLWEVSPFSLLLCQHQLLGKYCLMFIDQKNC